MSFLPGAASPAATSTIAQPWAQRTGVKFRERTAAPVARAVAAQVRD
jgi:hypothetical protein